MMSLITLNLAVLLALKRRASESKELSSITITGTMLPPWVTVRIVSTQQPLTLVPEPWLCLV